MDGQIHVINKRSDNRFTLEDLREFFDLSEIGFWKVEIEKGKSVQMYVDSNMQSLIGLPDELSAEESYAFYLEHIHPEDRYMISEYDTILLDKDMVAEYRYRHPEEGEIRIRCRCKKVGGGKDSIMIVGYEQKISDVLQLGSGTKREDELLKQNQVLKERQVQTNDYYKNLLDMMHCGVIAYTIPSHRILHMNAVAMHIYGVDCLEQAQDTIGSMLHSVAYPDADIPKQLKNLHYESGSVDYECTITNLKGESTVVVARTEAFHSPLQERCLVTTFLDVSENQALRNEKEILDTLCADYTSVYISDLTKDSIVPVYPVDVLEENVGKEKMGEAIHSFAGRVAFAYEHLIVRESAPDFLEKINTEFLMKYLQDHKRFVYRVRLKPNPYGRENYEIQVVRLNTEEGFKAILGFRYIDDVVKEEERRRIALEEAVEEAKLASESKTNFLRRMSHDIRTPLNGILGLIKIDEAHFDDIELVKENHQKMNASAKYLLSLINDVLQMSKLEAGKTVITHEPVDINKLSEDIVNIVIGRAAEAGIDWSYENVEEGRIYPYIYSSSVHLRQIFINIYSNCIKYNHPGGRITTKVSCREADNGGCIYRWEIKDTGIGMSEEFIQHIFDPFEQESRDIRTTSQGIGLGMAIVKGLIDQMGGSIRITSKEGVGSTFTVTIPFETASASEIADEQTGKDISIDGLRLLLVEDNELNAEIAQTLLKDEGAGVTLAANGEEAVHMFASGEPGAFDAILMDLMMPVMDGLTAAKKIRALDRSDAGTIPIIAMTANAFKEDEQKCLEAGMNGHLSKPIEIDRIKEQLGKLVH